MQYLKNVVSLKLDFGKCTGCGMCILVCPHAVFKLKNRIAEITDINNCMECGACALNCRFDAISVHSGVGCAAGILNGILNNSEPSCDSTITCEKDSKCC